MTQLQQRIAVKALIVNDQNQVLLLRKSKDDIRHAGGSGKYDLPGGKLDPGEAIQDGLVREIREETGLLIQDSVTTPIFVGEWRPIVKNIPYQIVGMFFVCRKWSGELTLSSEHDQYVWVSPETLESYKILPPGDKPISLFFKSASDDQ
jgi:8-oxo-dGTP diphosphatase